MWRTTGNVAGLTGGTCYQWSTIASALAGNQIIDIRVEAGSSGGQYRDFLGWVDDLVVEGGDIAQHVDFEIPAPGVGVSTDFERFGPGSPDGQFGWQISGPYDVEIVDPTTFGATGMGSRALRISSADVSGSFGDHVFSSEAHYDAGESTAEGGAGGIKGPLQDSFAAEFTLTSAVPGAEQVDQFVTVSPDRGDGARMSWVTVEDRADGLAVLFNDFVSDQAPPACDTGEAFVQTELQSGLDRSTAHTIRIEIDTVDGVGNDVVRVLIDGALVHTGTSWEDYFRQCEGVPTRTVDSLLFRVGGSPDTPALDGAGFLIDDVSVVSDQHHRCRTRPRPPRRGRSASADRTHGPRRQRECDR
ncbi:hypothetical protein [Euzebya sp.]|uniref:hypothetical protein n=1 Tax=Euzebya sp. TaxID=1971409 RepID=UPI003519AE66